MNDATSTAIDAAVRAAGIGAQAVEMRDLSGGCIHHVRLVTLNDHRRLVAKCNDRSALQMFEEEAIGLRAIAGTRTVLVPKVVSVGVHADLAVLLMSYVEPALDPANERTWRRFGEDLAALHMAPLPPLLTNGYGFESDNHIGATAQPNAWCKDWVEFIAKHRLGHQLRLAQSRGLLDAAESSAVERVIARLESLLPRQPRASLLHGDLWSGNIIPTMRQVADGTSAATCAVIDPAAYVGDALADIAMMRLFGGFDVACYDAWAANTGVKLADASIARQLEVHQLYHVLNHVNIFGRGYASQAMRLTRHLA